MQYGTSKPTGPWNLCLRVHQVPRCPGCAEFLQPCVIEFRDGWAWCQVCLMMGLHCEPWIASVLESESMCACRSVVNGLSFYTPGTLPGEVLTAYERREGLDGPTSLSTCTPPDVGVYALTAAGEVELADLDVKPLLKVELDLKRARECRSN